MKTQSTYKDWDFDDTWIIINFANNGYPILQWQLQDILKYAVVSAIPAKTYTGSEIEPAFTVTLGETVLEKNTDYTVSYSNNIKAGQAKITITGKGDYPGTTEAYFEITKKTITITGVTAVNRAYNGTTTVKLTGGKLSGVVSGDVVGFTLGNGTVASSAVGNNKAVTTNITLTGKDAGNYTLTQPKGITVAITDSNTPIISNRKNPNIGVQTTTNAILLSNLPPSTEVEVYNLQGKQIYSANPENSKILRILVQTKGIYVIKINNQTLRVAVM